MKDKSLGIRRPKTAPVKAFKWTLGFGQLAAVESLDGLVSYAFGVSAQGQVTGYSLTSNGQFHGFAADGAHWLRGRFRTLADDFSRAYHIGADGRVASYDAAPHGPNYAARWNPNTGRLQDHSAIGDGFALAWDINAQGMVVGYTQTPQNTTRTVMWQPAPPATDADGKLKCVNCALTKPADLAPGRNRSTSMSDIKSGQWALSTGAGYGGSSFGVLGGSGGGRTYTGYSGGGAGGFGGMGGGFGGSSSSSSSSGGEGEDVPEPA